MQTGFQSIAFSVDGHILKVFFKWRECRIRHLFSPVSERTKILMLEPVWYWNGIAGISLVTECSSTGLRYRMLDVDAQLWY
jgi:hypothetical protein